VTFVEQENVGPVDETACNRHALRHAARELARICLLESGQADKRNVLGGDAAFCGRIERRVLQAKGDVLLDRQPREQARLLEYDAAVEARAFDRAAVVPDLAVKSRLQPCDDPQQGRLSAPAGPHDGNELGRCDPQINTLERLKRLVADPEGLGNMPEAEVAVRHTVHLGKAGLRLSQELKNCMTAIIWNDSCVVNEIVY